MSIASELYRVCRREVAVRRPGRVREVHVALGELAGVEPRLLEIAWRALVAEGADAGAKLESQWHPLRQLCPRCGEIDERQPGSWLRLCPECSDPLQLEGGRELDLVSLVFEAEPVASASGARAGAAVSIGEDGR